MSSNSATLPYRNLHMYRQAAISTFIAKHLLSSRWERMPCHSSLLPQRLPDPIFSALTLVLPVGVSSLDTPAGEPLFGYVCSLHKQARLVELVTHL
jgi:hypothetical protein